MLFSKKAKSLSIVAFFLFLSACEVPDAPTGVPQPEPDLSTQGPICYQELECIVDTTRDNTLRRDAQEVINTLILTDQPEYNRICKAEADSLTESLPQCKREEADPGL